MVDLLNDITMLSTCATYETNCFRYKQQKIGIYKERDLKVAASNLNWNSFFASAIIIVNFGG